MLDWPEFEVWCDSLEDEGIETLGLRLGLFVGCFGRIGIGHVCEIFERDIMGRDGDGEWGGYECSWGLGYGCGWDGENHDHFGADLIGDNDIFHIAYSQRRMCECPGNGCDTGLNDDTGAGPQIACRNEGDGW